MDYSPHDLLPAPNPTTVCYPQGYFYDNVAKYLVTDTVRIMANGLHIDLDKVELLQVELDTQLENIANILANNNYVKQFLVQHHKKLINEYIKKRKTLLRLPKYYLKKFNPKDPIHRSYFMYIYANQRNITQPTELLPTGIPKWSAKHTKLFAATSPLLQSLIDKSISPTNNIALEAMQLLAEHKSSIYNQSIEAQIANPQIDLPPFSPGSVPQKQSLFELIGVESDATTAKGNPQWDRKQLERLLNTTTDPSLIELTQALIEYSQAAIIRSNFIEAFYNYTIDNRLYGNYKLLGAKSARYTSSNPNLLQLPSTGSVFAKPVKKCFTAPKGFLIGAIDYAALEDRIVANLSKDTNKLSIFTEGIDGHSLAATYYFPDKVTELIGLYTDNKLAAKQLKQLVDDGNQTAIDIRQSSKPISFGLAYGSFPPKVAATIKCSLEEAQTIFDAYHNDMFPGITNYRENYVLPTVQEYGEIHLGLGFTIKSDNPDNDIRTLNNATCQVWSILTALTINKLHQLIDKAELQNDILITANIYDAVYFEVRDDPRIVKWLNDVIIPIMTTDFMNNQIVHNEADLDIGTSWANLSKLPHNANINQIKEIISKVKENE